MQYFIVVVRIFKAHMLEGDASLHIFQGLCVLVVEDVYIRVHDLAEALDACHAALELLGEFDDAPDGGQQRGDVQHVGHKVARLDLAVEHKQAARHDHNKVHQPVEQACGGVEGGHPAVGLLFDVQEASVVLLEFFALKVLAAEGLHHALTQQAVLDAGVQFADVAALLEECGAHHMVKARAADDHNGHHRKHNEREPYVHAREDDE